MSFNKQSREQNSFKEVLAFKAQEETLQAPEGLMDREQGKSAMDREDLIHTLDLELGMRVRTQVMAGLELESTFLQVMDQMEGPCQIT